MMHTLAKSSYLLFLVIVDSFIYSTCILSHLKCNLQFVPSGALPIYCLSAGMFYLFFLEMATKSKINSKI
ncbi:hypothetical protein OIU77_012337, partial [Salix suchowensis]